MSEHGKSDPHIIQPGTPVDIHIQYDGSWSHGFEVAEIMEAEGAYRLRRISDGSDLPGWFAAQGVRKARKHRGSIPL